LRLTLLLSHSYRITLCPSFPASHHLDLPWRGSTLSERKVFTSTRWVGKSCLFDSSRCYDWGCWFNVEKFELIDTHNCGKTYHPRPGWPRSLVTPNSTSLAPDLPSAEMPFDIVSAFLQTCWLNSCPCWYGWRTYPDAPHCCSAWLPRSPQHSQIGYTSELAPSGLLQYTAVTHHIHQVLQLLGPRHRTVFGLCEGRGTGKKAVTTQLPWHLHALTSAQHGLNRQSPMHGMACTGSIVDQIPAFTSFDCVPPFVRARVRLVKARDSNHFKSYTLQLPA